VYVNTQLLEQVGFRFAGPDDAKPIALLHIESWKAAYRTELPASFLENQDVAARVAVWRNRLQSDELKAILAEAQGNLLGFCSFGWSQDAGAAPCTWEIKNLHISPALRGRGMGKELFERAVQCGRQAEALRLTLWVVASNTAARKFYEKQGMRADGAEQVHRVGDSAVLSEVRYYMALQQP
jgi:ribosomal protein S18 acetylase RimI-like enzyme